MGVLEHSYNLTLQSAWKEPGTFWLTIVEVALAVPSLAISLFCGWIFWSSSLYHVNLMRVLKLFLVCYVVCQLARLVMAVGECLKTVKGDDDAVSLNYMILVGIGDWQWLGIVRFCFFVAAFSALGPVVFERVMATIRLARYERTTSNVFFLFAFTYTVTPAVVTPYLYYHGIMNLTFIGISMFASNAIGIVILSFLKHYNSKQYMLSFSTDRYTLSERFQLQENIRTAGLIKKVSVIMAAMNVFLGITFLAASYLPGVVPTRICYITLNYVTTGYGYTTPFVGVRCTAAWRHFQERLRNNTSFSKILPEKLSVSSSIQTLKNFQGDPMAFNVKEETQIYFSQLEKCWS